MIESFHGQSSTSMHARIHCLLGCRAGSGGRPRANMLAKIQDWSNIDKLNALVPPIGSKASVSK
eukprot:scaffold9382_cov18-Tisochrysis_lutea.AAC.2